MKKKTLKILWTVSIASLLLGILTIPISEYVGNGKFIQGVRTLLMGIGIFIPALYLLYRIHIFGEKIGRDSTNFKSFEQRYYGDDFEELKTNIDEENQK